MSEFLPHSFQDSNNGDSSLAPDMLIITDDSNEAMLRDKAFKAVIPLSPDSSEVDIERS